MRIAEIYSHLNGHEHILVHKPQLWRELAEVVEGHYEGELYNVLRQGRGVPAVPLVLVGVAP